MKLMTVRKSLGIVALTLVAFAASTSVAGAASTLPSTWQRSMNFTAWTADGYGTDAARQSLRDLAALGTNRIVLTPTWYMDTAASNSVAPDPAKTPTDASLRSVMSDARSLGMRVTLKPHVDVRDGTFRGAIAPADRTAWFGSYGAMLSHYAHLARAGKADTLVVGTELTTMATDTASFQALIAQARSLFSGTLTYAANWIDGADAIGFWDRLDAIGIDAYMPLSTGRATPTVAALAAAWAPYVRRISDLHARTGQPVMFTELGYQSRTDALDHPASASGSPDPRIQEVAYAAALRVWRAVPWFKGISWWNWEAEPTGEDPAGSFSIAGKPAAAVLRDAQGGSAVTPGVERSGMTVPTGAGVLILVMLGGLAGVLYARRRPFDADPSDPPAPKPAAPTMPARPLPPARRVTRPIPMTGPALSFAQTAPTAAPAAIGAFMPAAAMRDNVGGNTPLPPRLAAACKVPTGQPPAAASAPCLPSRYHGAAV